MKAIDSGELKTESLKLLDGTGTEGILIMQDGKAVAKLVPLERAPEKGNVADFIGALKGKIRIKGDVFSTGIKWDAQS